MIYAYIVTQSCDDIAIQDCAQPKALARICVSPELARYCMKSCHICRRYTDKIMVHYLFSAMSV